MDLLRLEWRPVLSLRVILLALVLLFEDQSMLLDDSMLETEASNRLCYDDGTVEEKNVEVDGDWLVRDVGLLMLKDPEQFKKNVQVSMFGGTIDGLSYDNVIQ